MKTPRTKNKLEGKGLLLSSSTTNIRDETARRKEPSHVSRAPVEHAELSVKFDMKRRLITFSPEIVFEFRHYGADHKDDPTAEFEDPEAVKSAMEEVVKVFWKSKYESMEAVHRPNRRQSFSREHTIWSDKLAHARAELIFKSLIGFGIPRKRLSFRVDSEKADCSSSFIVFHSKAPA